MSIFNFQEMDIILALGLFLLLGFLGGRLANRLRFPALTGYIIVGLVIGPHLLRLVPEDMVGRLSPLTNFALGLISLTIGGRLSLSGLRKLGKSISYITLGLITVSFLLVSSLTFLFFLLRPGFSGPSSAYPLKTFILPLALLLGAIASTTAPAATIAVINECKAKGPLTDTLLAVVAINNAFGIILFGVIFALSGVLAGNGGGNPFPAMAARGFMNIFGAISLGLIAGLALGSFARFVREKSDLLIIILGAVMFTTGLASLLGFSLLLANMAAGFILINKAKRSQRIFGTIATIDMPIYVAFFVLAGAHLNWRLLPGVGLLGLIYLLARGYGKLLGAKWGAARSGAPEIVRKYLGFCLIPQAGVAIGLVLLIQQESGFQAFSGIISTVVLAGIVVNEIVGSLFTRMAIIRAGEAEKSGRE